MALLFKNIKYKIIELTPIILLFIIAFNGISIFDFNFFSVNILYILVYFWVLRQPKILGNGVIFLSGIITDVVVGFPIGSTAISVLIIAGVAAYVRVVTVRISLVNDWISFIPALLVANLAYFMALYFSDYSIDYIYLFKNSISTFIFYPFLWFIFSMLLNLMRS